MHLSAQEFNAHFLTSSESALQIFPQTKDRAVVNIDTPRKLGLFKGKIKMSDDFNEPLPDSFWLEGKL